MSPTLRRAADADSEAMVALHRAAIRSAGSDPDDVPGNEDLTRPEAAFHDVGGELLVLVADGDEGVHVRDGDDNPSESSGIAPGNLLAMGGYKPRDDRTVEVVRMAVADGARGEGYGSRVLAALERRARAAGFERVELETTARQTRAMAFYPRRGYTETGRRRVDEYEVVGFEKRL